MNTIQFPNGSEFSVDLDENTEPADLSLTLVDRWMSQGQPFIHAITAATAVCCGARWATVNELVAEKEQVKICSFIDNGEFQDCFEYEFEDTPCQEVLASEAFLHFSDVQRAFPEDRDLQEMGVIDYAGKSFQDEHGDTVGHLVVLHDNDLGNYLQIEKVMANMTSMLHILWQERNITGQ